MSEQARRYPLPVAESSLAALVPCSRGSGCPLGVDAPAIANAIFAGDHARAYLLARGPNPFASSCGHGCHAPCETACRRRYFGAPVAIASLEAYASGFSVPAVLASPGPCTTVHDARSVAGLVHRDVDGAVRAPRSGRRIAIIGAGAAGLACAHDLALLGHSCVVFDAGAEPGGLLTSALPAFRFPVASARAECATILGLGVEFRGGCRVEGTDALRSLLADEFDAIFLGLGASDPCGTLFPGQPEHPDILDGMAVLAREIALAGRIVIAGDGELAIDAARVALHRGRSGKDSPVTSVEVVLETPLEESMLSPTLIAAALQDGVVIHAGWKPVRYLVHAESGAVTALDIERGRERASKLLPCDHLVTAPPRTPPSAIFGDEIATDERGYAIVDPETLRTSMRGVYAGGACAFGHRSIAHAAADGKRAAWQIHAALRGRAVRPELSSAWIEIDDWDGERRERAVAASHAVTIRGGAPPADPFSSGALCSAHEVQHEASRCFDCAILPVIDDSCTACGKCIPACPVGALSLSTGRPQLLRLDGDLCHRCGACVELCPEGAIAMARAVWEERLSYQR